jgi:2-polyprenyl-6-hydroxyphenyl methylase/3-demethylubiquinone-9 3-methyltransferase
MSIQEPGEKSPVLRKDELKAAKPTADAEEIERFNRLADEWWKPDGAFKVVHAFNDARIGYLSQQLPAFSGRCPLRDKPLAGLKLLDAGCGAGLVSEPMARLGADVTGIDASERNVMVARQHADRAGLAIDYRHALPEDLASEDGGYDIVLSLEVVEHVADVKGFLEAIGRLVKPGGTLVIGTLNRTPQSYLKAILGAEYVLRWLPRGTHDWRKFVAPGELDGHLTPLGFRTVDCRGVALSPLTFRWSINADTSVNYMQIHQRALTFSGRQPRPRS